MATGIIANNFYVLYNKQNVLERFVYEKLLQRCCLLYLRLKIIRGQKVKINFQSYFSLEDKRNKGITNCYIDEQGFEQFKESIIKEENELENSKLI